MDGWSLEPATDPLRGGTLGTRPAPARRIWRLRRKKGSAGAAEWGCSALWEASGSTWSSGPQGVLSTASRCRARLSAVCSPVLPAASPRPGAKSKCWSLSSPWSSLHAARRICPASATPLLPTALEPLKDVHLGLAPPGRGPARLTILSGHYLYYHYGCDGLDDRGWGCGYRTLQTLCSWPDGLPAGVPGLVEVQAALEDMGDKPRGFRGSRSWIGCVEAGLCLDYFGGPQGRLCHVPRGAGLQGELERLYSHFAGGGGPVMVGGDVDAQSKALLGVCLGPGTEAYVLVLDPHCWGAPKTLSELQVAGWVGWREVCTTFDPNSFYNLCLTSHNSEKQLHSQD